MLICVLPRVLTLPGTVISLYLQCAHTHAPAPLGKGRGLYLTQSVEKDEPLFVERALAVSEASCSADACKGAERLSSEDQIKRTAAMSQEELIGKVCRHLPHPPCTCTYAPLCATYESWFLLHCVHDFSVAVEVDIEVGVLACVGTPSHLRLAW